MQFRFILTFVLGLMLIIALVLFGKEYVTPKVEVASDLVTTQETAEPLASPQPLVSAPLKLTPLDIGLKLPPKYGYWRLC